MNELRQCPICGNVHDDEFIAFCERNQSHVMCVACSTEDEYKMPLTPVPAFLLATNPVTLRANIKRAIQIASPRLRKLMYRSRLVEMAISSAPRAVVQAKRRTS